MSPLPANALLKSGQIVESPAQRALGTGPSAFSKVRDQAARQQVPTSQQAISQPSAKPPSLSFGPVSPASAKVLQPKVDHVVNSLSRLNVQLATVKPPTTAAPLRNRLQLLETQFQLIGSNLHQAGPQKDPVQLLKLQNDIYQIGEELELLSKVVDQATNGVRSLLQTQL